MLQARSGLGALPMQRTSVPNEKKASPEGLAYESLYRRGCLKGRICMHRSKFFCKCEMKNRDCNFCNRILIFLHAPPSLPCCH